MPAQAHLSPKRKVTALARQLSTGRDELSVLFNSFGGRFSDNPRAVYEELVSRGTGHRPVWVVDDGVSVPAALHGVHPATPEYAEAVGRAGLVVSNAAMTHYVKKPGVRYLQTWHGTPLKRIGYDNPRYRDDPQGMRRARRDYRRWDLLLSQNSFSTGVFRRAFRYEGEILESGYPRNDLLVAPHAAEVRAAVRAAFSIEEQVLLVLYAPTFRDDTADAKQAPLALDLTVLQAALGDSVHVLARPHHRDLASLYEPPSTFWTTASGYPDIRDLYLAADVLVTDYSSVMFDFAVTGKPMVFYTYDLDRYRDELRGFYFDLLEQAPGPVCTTSEQVAESLSDLPLVRTRHRASYERFRETYCPWDDGGASARVVDRLLSF